MVEPASICGLRIRLRRSRRPGHTGATLCTQKVSVAKDSVQAAVAVSPHLMPTAHTMLSAQALLAVVEKRLSNVNVYVPLSIRVTGLTPADSPR